MEINSALLFLPAPDLPEPISQKLISTLTSSILKPMVNFLAEGMAPAISFSGHQRKIVSLRNGTIAVNSQTLKSLSGGISNLVLLATADLDGNARIISPVCLVEKLELEGASAFYLDETLPPDGVSSFEELKIWVDSEKSVNDTYSWINEWNGSFPLQFTNCAGIREFGQKKDRFLTIEK